MVDAVASAWVDEQKEPKPWVGNSSVSSGNSAASFWAEAYWWVCQRAGVRLAE
jgi:hypothetical protein